MMAAGGAERLFLEEERFLRARGFDVTTAVFEFSPDALFDYRPEKFICLQARGHFTRLARLVKLIWRLRPDLVIAPSNSEAVYLFLASWFAPVRYAVHVHGSHFWFETDKLKYACIHSGVFAEIRHSLRGHREFIPAEIRMGWTDCIRNECVAILDYWAIRRARFLVALTHQVAWEIELLYGRKARVCRGCLSREWLDLGRQAAKGSSLTRIGKDSPRVIFSVGRLDPRKRIDVLLRAFAMVAEGEANLRLVIGGAGPEARNLHLLTCQLGLQDKVEFCGFISDCDLPAYYLRAEVFAFPSWTTSGITPYEAMAFGCKVVWTSEAEEPVLDLPGVHVADPAPYDFARGLLCALNDSSRPPLEELENYSWDRYFEGVAQILLPAAHRGSGEQEWEENQESPTIPANQE